MVVLIMGPGQGAISVHKIRVEFQNLGHLSDLELHRRAHPGRVRGHLRAFLGSQEKVVGGEAAGRRLLDEGSFRLGWLCAQECSHLLCDLTLHRENVRERSVELPFPQPRGVSGVGQPDVNVNLFAVAPRLPF